MLYPTKIHKATDLKGPALAFEKVDWQPPVENRPHMCTGFAVEAGNTNVSVLHSRKVRNDNLHSLQVPCPNIVPKSLQILDHESSAASGRWRTTSLQKRLCTFPFSLGLTKHSKLRRVPLRKFQVGFEDTPLSNVEDVEAARSQNTTHEKVAVAKCRIFFAAQKCKAIFFRAAFGPYYP